MLGAFVRLLYEFRKKETQSDHNLQMAKRTNSPETKTKTKTKTKTNPSKPTKQKSSNFDTTRFIDNKVEKLFNKYFKKKAVLAEHVVALDELRHTCIPSVFRARDWEPLLNPVSPPSELFVREFYANIHTIDKASSSFTKMDDQEERDLWTSTNELLFLNILIECVASGMIVSERFDSHAQNIVTALINRCVKRKFNTKQIKGKWNRMKHAYIDFAFILKQTGFGWDDERHTVVASEEAWSNLLRSNPKLGKYKRQGCPNFNLMGVVFSQFTATGSGCHSSTHAPVSPVNEPLLEQVNYNLGDVQVDLEQDPPVVTQMGTSPALATPSPRYGKRATDGSTPSQNRRKKEKIEAEMSDCVRAMTNFCKVHSSASGSQFTVVNMSGNSEFTQPPCTITKCIRWLSELSPPLPESQYHEAIDRLLENKERQLAFLEMPPERRLEWLYCL
ncbi:hypothetical protein CJ030_MR0G008814 [Morella rubra]|uniref:Myb/SANT-like domain-containing protein n=1 Tax=Morella rubra TaxID=262757 RepID=A0A6A1UHS7_9ROSI|nr:hypothetical protein CJ030_MR0G008814 [Morella rubra]